MPTDADFERVLAQSPEVAPFPFEEAWTGSSGGCWQFWNRIWRARLSTAPQRDEVLS